MNLFFITAFILYSAINGYIFYKGWKVLSEKKAWRMAYTIVFLFLFSSFIIAMLGRNFMNLTLQKFLYFPGTCWLGAIIYLFLFFLITDLILLIGRYFSRFNSKSMGKLRRMQFYLGYGLTAFLLIYGYNHFNNPRIVEKDLVFAHKEQMRSYGTRIVAVSDLHLGVNLDRKKLAEYIDIINAQHPDIVLFVGDIIDNSVFPLEKEKMWEEFGRLKTQYGAYACLGNHEYMSGIEKSLAFLVKTKLNLLVDNSMTGINGLQIIGRDDIKGNPKRKSLKELMANVNPNLPVIVMDHEPYHLEEAEENGIDLQFSGHTHDGQMWPGNLLVKSMYELPYGYMQKGDTHYFTTSGLGLWGPLFRIGTQSEIVIFNIQFN
jgi:predicted MPP superfamily phosphohydrolase